MCASPSLERATIISSASLRLDRLGRHFGQEIEQSDRVVAELLDDEHMLRRKPSQLASDQQQRGALGRAIVKRPLVCLLDGPFSNLDTALRSRMRTEVKHLHLQLGTT